jgi:hypothetical protein
MIAAGWLTWLGLFLAYEVPAAIAEVWYAKVKKRHVAITLSRNTWRWLGLAKGQEWRPCRRWRQAFMFVFLQVLAFHLSFATPSGAWVIATGAPVALILGYAALVEDRREREYWRRFWKRLDARLNPDGGYPPLHKPLPPPPPRVTRADVEHAEHIRADAAATRAGEGIMVGVWGSDEDGWRAVGTKKGGQ